MFIEVDDAADIEPGITDAHLFAAIHDPQGQAGAARVTIEGGEIVSVFGYAIPLESGENVKVEDWFGVHHQALVFVRYFISEDDPTTALVLAAREARGKEFDEYG